jgi:ribosomal protein S18 acetylase RimI-like enzyme
MWRRQFIIEGAHSVTSQRWTVLSRASLGADEAAAVRQLVSICDDVDGLRLKISIYAAAADLSEEPSMYLVYDGVRLAGCCSVDYDGDRDAEICGAALPEYRRRGIGRALFTAAREDLRRRGASTVLLICEDGSVTGQAFVAAVHGVLRHKELHMERPAGLLLPTRAPAAGVTVRPATRADLDALVPIMARAFGDDEAGVRRRVLSEVDDPTMPYLVVTAGGNLVGSLKPYELSGTIGLYAVAVLPERQGKGYGKWLMLGAMHWLSQRFPDKPFVLEVDPDNAPAQAVYTATGFVVTTVYGYYAV